jgi:hypothetical protein
VQSTPFSKDVKEVGLTVRAGSPLAEVFLIDHEFALQKRSVGDLETSVPPGVYKVKATLGEIVAERLVVLNAKTEIDLGEELRLASPAPLAGTDFTREKHVALVSERSRSVEHHAGAGAKVLLVSRRYSGDAAGPEAAQSSLAELSLRTRDGERVAYVGSTDGSDPIEATTVEVDPGPYRLRWRDHSGGISEQTLYAVRDWQTHAFVLEDAVGPEEALRNKVSILMSQQDFDPGDEHLRLVEEVRAALADERKVTGEQNNALFAKFDNPMLGLFGAHLMLLGQEAVKYAKEAKSDPDVTQRPQAPVTFEQDLFDGAVGNLGALLGRDHPDVVALSTKVKDVDRDKIRPIEAPPMLWRSWLLLVEASNDWPDLVPVHLWRETARLLPLRPFMVWSLPGDDDDGAADAGELEMARLIKRTVDEAAGAAASAAVDAARRELTSRMLAPSAAIDELIRKVS